MLVFLLSSVHFLFLLLLSAVQTPHNIHIHSLEQNIMDVARVEMCALRDETGVFELQQFEQLVWRVQVSEEAGAVHLVKPDLHMWPIILKYIY